VDIACSRCRSVLATGLWPASVSVLNRNAVDEPSLPAGTFVVDPAATVRTELLSGTETQQAPANAVVVRPDALVDGAVEVTMGTPTGCCGLTGSRAPNQDCAACGQVLGTAWTDCCTQHEVRFAPTAVTLSE
jgi:hypothetical protein